jgi:hypothetical protein
MNSYEMPLPRFGNSFPYPFIHINTKEKTDDIDESS